MPLSSALTLGLTVPRSCLFLSFYVAGKEKIACRGFEYGAIKMKRDERSGSRCIFNARECEFLREI